MERLGIGGVVAGLGSVVVQRGRRYLGGALS